MMMRMRKSVMYYGTNASNIVQYRRTGKVYVSGLLYIPKMFSNILSKILSLKYSECSKIFKIFKIFASSITLFHPPISYLDCSCMY